MKLNRLFMLSTLIVALMLGSTQSIAQDVGIRFVSEPEFQKLSEDLSKKVNLFERVWQSDPKAEFFGGTTRDFLYWVARQFRDVHSRKEALQVEEALRSKPIIDVRDFVIGDSDVDVIGSVGGLTAGDFGLKKIDHIDAGRLNPKTPMGLNEIQQGYIPTEKIRLSSTGFKDWPGFGNGLHEIYTGHPTVHFSAPDVFDQSYYASKKLNHPILLAIRYLRAVGMSYYQRHGTGAPDPEKLYSLIDDNTAAEIQKIVDASLYTTQLREHFGQPQFVKWLNQVAQKAFRSYTNPTATYLLFKRFKLDDFVAKYSDKVDPINQYLFAKARDPEQIRKNFEKYRTTPEELFEKTEEVLPNLKGYHGTRTDEAFSAILKQGILPSVDGAVGPGLYMVSEKEKQFAADWGGYWDLVVEFQVDPSAKVIDLTKGKGAELFNQFTHNTDALADAFGADILEYHLGSTIAFVVKNSAVLSKPKGLTRQIMTLSQMEEMALEADTEEKAQNIFNTLRLNNFSYKELHHVISSISYYKPSEALSALEGLPADQKITALRLAPVYGGRSEGLKNRLIEVRAKLAAFEDLQGTSEGYLERRSYALQAIASFSNIRFLLQDPKKNEAALMGARNEFITALRDFQDAGKLRPKKSGKIVQNFQASLKQGKDREIIRAMAGTIAPSDLKTEERMELLNDLAEAEVKVPDVVKAVKENAMGFAAIAQVPLLAGTTGLGLLAHFGDTTGGLLWFISGASTLVGLPAAMMGWAAASYDGEDPEFLLGARQLYQALTKEISKNLNSSELHGSCILKELEN